MRPFVKISGERARAGGFGAFISDRRGVTLVEFALIAPVFFLLLFSILEIALISLSTATYETGFSQASRLVRVGEAQCLTDAQFVRAICDKAGFAPSCEARTTIEREIYQPDFTPDRTLTVSPTEFSQLAGGTVVKVSATYRWPLLSPIVEPFFTDGEGRFAYRLSFLFKNEGFERATCGA